MRVRSAAYRRDSNSNIFFSRNLNYRCTKAANLNCRQRQKPLTPDRRRVMQNAADALLGKVRLPAQTFQESALTQQMQIILLEQLGMKNEFVSEEEAVTVEVSTPSPIQSEKPQPKCADIPFKTFAAIYIDHFRNVDAPGTLKGRQRILQTYILPLVGERILGQITKKYIALLKAKIAESSPNGAIQSLRLLRHMFKHSSLMGYSFVNPMQIEDERFAEISRILEQVRLIHDPSMSAAVQLGFYLGVGMRGEEITSLEWSDVDLEKKRIRIQNSQGQYTYKSLSTELCSMLKNLPSFDKCEYVFPSRKGRGPVTRIDKSWKRACLNAGISDRILLNMKAASVLYKKPAQE